MLVTTQEKQDMALNGPQQSAQQQLPERLLSMREAMAYLRVSRSTVYRLMRSGQLPGHKVGHTWRFYRSELQASVREAKPAGKQQKTAVLL